MEKSIIRKAYKQRRLSMETAQTEEYSRQIADNFIYNLLPKIADFNKKKLGFYLANRNEVNPFFIMEHCRKLGNSVSIPKILPNQKLLEFKLYQNGDDLVFNPSYKNLLEPKSEKLTVVPDIIFVPLVAFDHLGYRIGMGGGFYDATINFYQQSKAKSQNGKIFIGLAYNWQKLPAIKTDQWDAKLNFIVCENEIIKG